MCPRAHWRTCQTQGDREKLVSLDGVREVAQLDRGLPTHLEEGGVRTDCTFKAWSYSAPCACHLPSPQKAPPCLVTQD